MTVVLTNIFTANGTLSANSLQLTCTNGGNEILASCPGLTTGNSYAEFTFVYSGVHSTVQPEVVFSGGSRNVVLEDTTTTYYNGTYAYYSLGTPTTGSIIGVAYNAANQNIWLRVNNGYWNASSTADPGSGTGGFALNGSNTISSISLLDPQVGDRLSANFGPTYSYTAPTSYSGWNGSNANTLTTFQQSFVSIIG